MIVGTGCRRRKWAAAARVFALLMIAAGAVPSAAAASHPVGDGSWVQSPGAGQLSEAVLVDAQLGWGVGNGGLITATTDGGATWTTQDSGTTQNLTHLAFADGDNGWAAGPPNFIYHTTDGGAHWIQQTLGATNEISDLDVVSATHAWALNSVELLRTTDGGAHWIRIQGPDDELRQLVNNAGHLSFVDENEGWVSGSTVAGYYSTYPALVHTTDGGASWERSSLPAALDYSYLGLGDVLFADAEHGWVTAGARRLLRTDNGGADWTVVNLGDFEIEPGGDPDHLACYGADYVWGAGSGGWVVHSIDGGRSWRVQGIDNCAVSTFAVSFGDYLHGIVTSGGSPFVTSTAGVADTEAPVTTAVGAAVWQRPPAVVSLSPIDLLNGILYSEYDLDGVGWVKGSSLSTPVEGTHTLSVRSCDRAGNLESPPVATSVLVDGTAPTTSCTPAPGDWVMEPWTPQFSAADQTDLSGVDHTEYRVGDGEWTNSATFPQVVDEGEDTFSYRSVDVAGNVEAAKTMPIKIDLNPPSTTTSLAATWYDSAVPVTLTATDAGAGVANVYSSVAGAPFVAGTTITIQPSGTTGGGMRDVAYYAVDNVGRQEAVNHVSVGIDTAKPVSRLTPRKKWQLDYWNNTASYVAVRGTDTGGSTLLQTEICLDRSTWQVWPQGEEVYTPAPKSHENDGVHPLWVRSTDVAGNVSAVKKHTIDIDTRKPSGGAPAASTVASGGTATLRFRINDPKPCCGVGKVAFVITNLAATKRLKVLAPNHWYTKNTSHGYSFRCTLPRGTYRFFVWAMDGAGNVSTNYATKKLIVR